MGLSQVSSHAFVFGRLTTLTAFIEGGFGAAIIGLSICFILSAVIAYIIGFYDLVDSVKDELE